MLDTPHITNTGALPAAVIRLTVARSEMQKVMGPAVAELMGTVSTQGRTPAGPLFAHHLRIDPGTFDFELGVPVDAPVEAAGRVQPGELPAATIARTIYHGPYEGLPDAWRDFDAWVRQQGHEPAADLWECYVVGPESTADPDRWQTELNRPLQPRD